MYAFFSETYIVIYVCDIQLVSDLASNRLSCSENSYFVFRKAFPKAVELCRSHS